MGTFRILALLLAILHCSSVKGEATEYVKYKDPKQPLHTRINDLLKRMTLAEKIGQMAQIERVNATPEAIKNYFIGVLLMPEWSQFTYIYLFCGENNNLGFYGVGNFIVCR